MNVVIRKLTVNDYNDMKKLDRELYEYHKSLRPDIYAKFIEMTPQDFEKDINDKNKYMIGAVVDNQLIGYLEAKFKDTYRDVLWIDALYVSPECRGKGIATKLMKETEEFAKSKKLPIEFYAASENKSAIKLYQNLGYKIQRYTFEKD